MDASGRFWRSAGLSTGGMLILLLLWGVYEILTAQTLMPVSEMLEGLFYGIPLLLALALPVSAFVAGFSAAHDVFKSRGERRARVVGVGGLVLAVACLVILGYLSPLLQAAYGDPEPYLHELPSAWREALAQGTAESANAPMRWYEAGEISWDLFFRLSWSVLVALMAGIGLLSGYWARWTPDRRVVALQAWAIALLLALVVIAGLVIGHGLALQSGAGLFGAWQIVRGPLLVLVVLAWPTWLSLRNPRRAIASPSDGAGA